MGFFGMTRQAFTIRSTAVAAALAALVSFGGSARAVPVTVTMNGHLTSIPTQVGGAFSAGEAFTFNYTYDTTTGNAGGSTNAIYYYDSYHLDIGGGAFTVDATAGAVFANSVQIINLSSFDAYKVDATDGLSYSPHSALLDPNTSIQYFLVQVFTQFSYAASQFSGPALPPGAPPYTSANGFNLQLRPDPGSLDGRIFVQGVIDSVSDNSVVATPAPAALALFAPGLALIGLLRRRRHG